jgi:hypothetical protein
MTLEKQIFNHETGRVDERYMDPNSGDVGRSIIERDLTSARQKLFLARAALREGSIGPEDYQSVAEQLQVVEQRAIAANYDPTLFDDNTIDRGRHY